MTLKMTDPVAVAATKVGLSQAIGYRLRADPTLLSQKKAPLRPAWGDFQDRSAVTSKVSTGDAAGRVLRRTTAPLCRTDHVNLCGFLCQNVTENSATVQKWPS